MAMPSLSSHPALCTTTLMRQVATKLPGPFRSFQVQHAPHEQFLFVSLLDMWYHVVQCLEELQQ